MNGDGEFRGVELRVHGIGDHDVYSAIGSPPVITGSSGPGPGTAELPALPLHTVLFFNWSRTSRNLAGILWYLALPFSFVNVAGQMVPARNREEAPPKGRPPVRLLSGLVILVSLLLTAVGYLWMVAIGETVLRSVRFDATVRSGASLVIWIAVGLALGVIARGITLWLRRGSSYEGTRDGTRPATSDLMNRRVALGLAASHTVTIGLVAWLLLAIRPARMASPESLKIPILTACLPVGEVPEDCAIGFNALNAFVIASTAIVVALSLVLLLASFHRGYRHVGGVAVALTTAILLAHAFGSAVRVGVDWILLYLDRFDSLGRIARHEGLGWSDRYLLPYQANRDGLFGSFADMAPFLALLALLGLLGAIALVNSVLPSGPRFGDLFRGATLRLRYIHQTVTRLGPRMGVCYVIGVAVWGLALWWVVASIDDGRRGRHSQLDVAVLDVLVVVTNVTAVLAAIFLLSGGRIGALRRTFAVIADVVGFWSVTWHPLAGRTYRTVVVPAIASEVDRLLNDEKRLVLVAHSQGSVLAVWCLAHTHHAARSGATTLITCGSPVVSLYAALFPRFFDPQLLGTARASVHTWANFWRGTDPIATPLDPQLDQSCVGRIADGELPDPRDGCTASTPMGHGDYWNEPELKNVSEPWLAR